jgi:hypothetical protein
MRYGKAPLSQFMREVVFGTPQGLTGVFFSVLSLVAGFIWTVSSTVLPGLTLLGFGFGFFFYPVFLFYGIVAITAGFTLSREYEPKFSLFDTAAMALLGFLPFAMPYLHEYCGGRVFSWACWFK